MSSFLYDIGRWCFRRRGPVVLAWLAFVVVVGGFAALLAKPMSDSFSIPGAPSQAAYDQLKMTFPEAADAGATVLVTVPAGQSVKDAAIQKQIEAGIDHLTQLPYVLGAISPYNEYVSGRISADDRTAMVAIRVTGTVSTFTDAQREDLLHQAADFQKLLPPGTQVLVGGEVYAVSIPRITIIEGVGVLVALVVLVVTMGSVVAGLVPLLNALVGVGLAMAITYGATRFAEINSTTPMLALMLGLAVGIDYALFILSRHKDQLADPTLSPEESTARSVATAGSAVVFAGLTVIIALIGLAVAQIPFLTVMGAYAAVAVAIGVAVALTLLPAVMGYLGERMRPKCRSRTPEPPVKPAPRTGGGASGWWVRVVTKVPVLTIVLVVAGLGALALPAKDLWLSLPNAGQLAPGEPARQTYDAVAQAFGPGQNGPLVVTMQLVESTDPLGVLDGIKADIEKLPGVASVPMAVPNRNADTGMIQVIPTTAPDDPRTDQVTKRILDLAPQWKQRYGVNVAVTGITAVGLDITAQLSGALLPFGIFVVGLSLVLLMIVFRSIAVPVKAAIGYLLSIGGAFGATTLVFNQGWFGSLINLHDKTAVISFFPIITMGILFGLAMDYEVFLVSRMREEHVHGDDAQLAVHDGFVHSAKVVVAAALIMFAVFAFFVPNGEGAIKPIAFGLALGVVIDAFLVRMTLVPAVMHLLGEKAWWLPRWLDRLLPSFDVEGESLARQLALADWPAPGDPRVIYAEDLVVGSDPVLVDRLTVGLLPGRALVVAGDPVARRALMLTLGGRMAPASGRLKVLGFVVPDSSAKVRRRATVLAAEDVRVGWQPTALTVIDDVDRLRGPARDVLARALLEEGRSAFVLGAQSTDAIADLIRPSDYVLHLDGAVESAPVGAQRMVGTTRRAASAGQGSTT